MKKKILCETIKSIIFSVIENDEVIKQTFSIYISEKLNKKYSYLSKIFVKKYGFSINKYINLTKVERVKKLIDEDILNIGEIADKMHYSSIGHLSHHFKIVTKMTPLFYKKIGVRKLKH